MNNHEIITRTYNEVRALYLQAMVSQAQWEAFDYLFGLVKPTPEVGSFSALCSDTKIEFWEMVKALPQKLATLARVRLLDHYS